MMAVDDRATTSAGGTARKAMVRYAFRAGWAGLFVGAILLTLLMLGILVYGIASGNSISALGMDLEMRPNGAFLMMVDIRPGVVATLASSVLGAALGAAYARRKVRRP
jgi:hypothetical protein